MSMKRIEIGGKLYTLQFTNASVRAVEKELNKSIWEIMHVREFEGKTEKDIEKGIDIYKFSISDYSVLWWACLLKFQPLTNLQMGESLLDEWQDEHNKDFSDVMGMVSDLIAESNVISKKSKEVLEPAVPDFIKIDQDVKEDEKQDPKP